MKSNKQIQSSNSLMEQDTEIESCHSEDFDNLLELSDIPDNDFHILDDEEQNNQIKIEKMLFQSQYTHIYSTSNDTALKLSTHQTQYNNNNNNQVNQAYTQVKNDQDLQPISCHSKHCQYLENEYNLLSQISHPNILKVQGLYYNQLINDQNLCGCVLEMDKMTMDFFEFYIEQNHFDFIQFKTSFAKIIQAISYLHQNNISHNDIKPENLFLKQIDTINTVKSNQLRTNQQQQNQQQQQNKNQLENTLYEVFLGDFGQAKYGEYQQGPLEQYQAWEERDLAFSGAEVSQFLNTCQLQQQQCEQPQQQQTIQEFNEQKNDIFALGQSLFMCLTKKYPRSTKIPSEECPIYKQIAEQNSEGFWEQVQQFSPFLNNFEQCKDFLEICMKMMAPNPEDRPDCNTILKSKFFTSLL